MKIATKILGFSAICVAIAAFASGAAKAQIYENCGQNFEAKFDYVGLLPMKPTTGITIPVNSYFRTRLEITAKGKDDLEVGDNVDIVLVMDRSGSMSRTADGEKKIEKAKEALQQVVAVFKGVNKPENRLALVTYNSSVTLDQPLTSEYDKVIDAIESFDAGGTTNIGGALSVAASHLKNAGNEDSKKFIVIATDGVHNTGTPVSVGIDNVGDNITTYSVGIGDSSYYDEDILKAIAGAGTGEGSYYPSSVGDLTQTFENIIKDILTPFRPENISLSFGRQNVDLFSLNETDPSHSELVDDDVIWDDLSAMVNNESKDFNIDFLQSGGFGVDLAVNQPYVEITYNLFGRNCVEQVPIDVFTVDYEPQCTGSEPANAEKCLNDDLGLTVDVPMTLVESCSNSQKCEYTCQSPYEYYKGACKMRSSCGSLADQFWCRSLPNTDYCDDGYLIGGPYASGGDWSWLCGGSDYITVACNGRRMCPNNYREVSY